MFCNHKILSEEDQEHKSQSLQEPTLIIDPIDGTVGYANNQYQVAVSIAYAVNYKVRYGVVYNPFLDEMFYASENSGAFLNGNKIIVKDVSELRTCVINSSILECVNGNNIIVSSPKVFDELKQILAYLSK